MKLFTVETIAEASVKAIAIEGKQKKGSETKGDSKQSGNKSSSSQHKEEKKKVVGSNEQIKEPHVINASDSNFGEDGMDEVSSIPFQSPGDEKKHEDGTVLLKHIVCSRADSNESKMDVDFEDFSSISKKRRRTVSSRCSCKAKVVFKFDGLKGYNVLSFIEEHSHFLVSGSGKQFLKSNRVLGLAHKKLSRDVKLYIGDRDAQMIIEKFTDKKEMCDGFFYDYAVDEGGRLTRIFWADVIGRRNYDVFGDVISFDSTYSTKKYNMKFVPFTGLDNYEKCCVFAAGLITKEDIDSYLAKCISKMDDFKRKINALIWSIDIDPAIFEVGWKDVMKEFKLETYYADDPMVGLLRTTSISESENSFFDKFNHRSDTLTEFYLRYESAMDKQRHTNVRLNYEGKKSMPRMDTPLLLERDAAELYTRTMFYEVQKEIMSSCYDMSINSISEQDGVKIFSMKDKKRHGKMFEVKVNNGD
ncbi:protein FAR1-RELATED SEQUENCE 5-like [Asparagus officinalis]|uniref:protein FAR1-RELATED SEQUENCE 5-like n=1 Tax=Asparagus officinalis TaxID=4686 RepID=UPI00098E5B3A|nr:protein FAR1-RELATED SEQUENCE 5-like [Asparagus officinalis]